MSRHFDARPRHIQRWPADPATNESFDEDGLVRKDREIVRCARVQVKELLVEKARWTRGRHHGSCTDYVHIAFCPSELTLHLGPNQSPLFFDGHLIDHRIPDGATELEVMQINGAV